LIGWWVPVVAWSGRHSGSRSSGGERRLHDATDRRSHGRRRHVDRVRPNPLRWVAYAYGAGLPPRYRTWVLHDVTTRTWVLRHITRSIVQFVPFAIVLFSSSPSTASNWVSGSVWGR
jgi:hypothetical protein